MFIIVEKRFTHIDNYKIYYKRQYFFGYIEIDTV